MDGDFQSNYLAAEQAYGAGDFETARSITLELLSQLEPVPEDGAERDAVLAWRAFVALLAGHIDLYGFQNPADAQGFYELVLASNPQDTLRELAEQGLERTRSDQESVIGSEQLTDPVESPDTEPVPTTTSLALIADPFLSEAAAAENPVQPAVTSTAMPWLKDAPSQNAQEQPLSSHNDEDAVAEPQPQPEPPPVSEPEPKPASADIKTDDEPSETFPEQPLSSHNDAEPDSGGELLRGSTTQAVNIETDLDSNHEISDAIRQRLETGRMRVVLPDRDELPSENSSDSSQVPDRWSRLRKALGRS